jgi:cell division protein FtsL
MARATATTAAATRRAPRTEAAPAKRARPDLAVVPRRRIVSPTSVIVTLLVCGLAFAALSVQISLIHRQQRLDAVRSDITEVQMANKELRQKESRLQAPAEILRIARDELGMVESKPPELVTPAVETVGAAPGSVTTVPPASTTPSDG